MADDGRIADAPFARRGRFAKPGSRGRDDLVLLRRGLVDPEGAAIGDDGFESDGIRRTRLEPFSDGHREAGGIDAGAGDLLDHRFDAHDLMGRPARGFAHLRGGEDLAAAQPAIDQQPIEAGGPEEPAVHLGGAQRQAALDIGLAGDRGLEIQQRRAEAADGKPERLLEFGGAGRRRAIALGEEGLEGGKIQLRRRDAVAVMIDQGNLFPTEIH